MKLLAHLRLSMMKGKRISSIVTISRTNRNFREIFFEDLSDKQLCIIFTFSCSGEILVNIMYKTKLVHIHSMPYSYIESVKKPIVVSNFSLRSSDEMVKNFLRAIILDISRVEMINENMLNILHSLHTMFSVKIVKRHR